MLTTDAEAPEVTQTTMGADLLQALQVITELGVDAVGEDLRVLAIDDVALTIEEPLLCDGQSSFPQDSEWVDSTYTGDLVGGRVLDDGNETLKLLRGELTGALVQVDIGLLAHQVGVATTDTLDLGQGVDDLLLSVNVCVEQTQNVVEVALDRWSAFVCYVCCAVFPGQIELLTKLLLLWGVEIVEIERPGVVTVKSNDSRLVWNWEWLDRGRCSGPQSDDLTIAQRNHCMLSISIVATPSRTIPRSCIPVSVARLSSQAKRVALGHLLDR